MNTKYGFIDELRKHYPDEQTSERAIRIIENFYNVLSIGAITPKGSLLVHGGIPKTITDIDTISRIPKPYSEIENLEDSIMRRESKMAISEIQWNDPSTNIETPYSPSWRGKGIYYFNDEALMTFLKENSLNRIVRAHESIRGGYQELFEGRLFHVFSSEPYFGKVERAAIIHETIDGIKAIGLDFKEW
jgi:hypothetical protein